MFRLLFLTSSRVKLQHARYLCRDHNLEIVKKSNYGVAYNEPRTPDRDKLFKESLEDAKKRLMRQTQGKASLPTEDMPLMQNNAFLQDIPLVLDKFFFIEDTSVRIHALSSGQNDTPGTEIKFWMREHDFSSVDELLKEHGNDRRVTVRSDILLYLPVHFHEDKDKDYIQFTSEVLGTVTEREFKFKTKELYPWLDNQSFNKWFIPSGCTRPISMLPVEEADKHDFRGGAFRNMLTFLERDHIITNGKPRKRMQTQRMLSLFDTPAFLVCGLPCAGKTTLGEFLSKDRGYYHIEASDFMYLSYYEKHGTDSTVKIGDFAEKVLKETPSIVVDQTLRHLAEIKDAPFVITGFRSPKEIENFRKKYRGPNRVEPIFIDADADTRFHRSLARKRNTDITSEKDFYDRDKQQLRMGLGDVKKRLRSNFIANNSSFESYFDSVLDKYPSIPLATSKSACLPKERPVLLDEAIMISLLNEEKYLTTTEIAHHINRCFAESEMRTNKNNISRYFNQKYHPYYETCVDRNKRKYRLSPTGRSRARFLLDYLVGNKMET